MTNLNAKVPEDQFRPPPHLSEKQFRKYEHVISKIVREFPKQCTFDPKPWSVETYKARLRDAMRSLITYKWPTPIDVSHLENIRSQIYVGEDRGLVVVRRNDDPNVITPISVEDSTPLPDKAAPLRVQSPDMRDLFALAHLLSRGFLVGPIQLINANPAEVAELGTKGFDIASREENGIIYLM